LVIKGLWFYTVENRSFLAFVPEIEILSLSALVKLNILVTIA
jgi:hypothetical protein